VEEEALASESRQTRCENVYTSKGESEVSWFQDNPAPSLALIAEFDARPASASIDIAAFVLSAAAATAIFRLNIGMLWVLAGSCAAGVALRLTGMI